MWQPVHMKKIAKVQIFDYTRCITPKRKTSLRAQLRVIAPEGNADPFEAVTIRLQRCVQFDQPEI